MATTYPPLPKFDRISGEPVRRTGARALAFLFETGCTCCLEEEELEHAEYMARFAVAARGISPTALDGINRVRHMISGALSRLARDRQAAETREITPTVSRASGGHRVPVRRPSPVVPPASGVANRF